LILWLTVCFAGSVMALGEATSPAACAAFAASLVPPLASFALAFEDLPDPWSRDLWTLLERLGFAAAIILLQVYLFADREETDGNLRSRLPLYGAATAISIAFAFLPLPPLLRAVLGLLPLLFLYIVAMLVAVSRESRGQAAAPASSSVQDTTGGPGEPHRLGLRSWHKIFPVARLGGFGTSIALPFFALGVMDLFSVGYLDRRLEILLIFLFWALFTERLAQKSLDESFKLVEGDVFKETVLWELIDKFSGFSSLRKAAGRARTFFAKLKVGIVAKAIVIPLFLVVLLIAMGEIFSYHGVVIEQFSWNGSADKKDDKEDEEDKDIAEIVSDGLANALGLLRKDLRADLVLAQRKSSGEHPADLRAFEGATNSGRVEAALGKGDAIEISTVKIPMTFLVGPFQRFIRSLFSIRTVSGSVQKIGGQIVVWARASDGETWRECTTDLNVPLKPEKANPSPTNAETGADATKPDGGDECNPDPESLRFKEPHTNSSRGWPFILRVAIPRFVRLA
jgi:hypothetical protein